MYKRVSLPGTTHRWGPTWAITLSHHANFVCIVHIWERFWCCPSNVSCAPAGTRWITSQFESLCHIPFSQIVHENVAVETEGAPWIQQKLWIADTPVMLNFCNIFFSFPKAMIVQVRPLRQLPSPARTPETCWRPIVVEAPFSYFWPVSRSGGVLCTDLALTLPLVHLSHVSQAMRPAMEWARKRQNFHKGLKRHRDEKWGLASVCRDQFSYKGLDLLRPMAVAVRYATVATFVKCVTPPERCANPRGLAGVPLQREKWEQKQPMVVQKRVSSEFNGWSSLKLLSSANPPRASQTHLTPLGRAGAVAQLVAWVGVRNTQRASRDAWRLQVRHGECVQGQRQPRSVDLERAGLPVRGGVSEQHAEEQHGASEAAAEGVSARGGRATESLQTESANAHEK